MPVYCAEQNVCQRRCLLQILAVDIAVLTFAADLLLSVNPPFSAR